MNFKKTKTYVLLFLILISWPQASLSKPKDKRLQVQILSQALVQELTLRSSESFHVQWERAHSGKKESLSWPAETPLKLLLGADSLGLSPSLKNPFRRVEISSPNSGNLILQAGGMRKVLSQTSLVITPRKQGLQVIAQLTPEYYTSVVLASELPQDFPLEALKAQAVLIRTQTQKRPYPHQNEGFDFCDSTHCQLFAPKNFLSEKFRSATLETQDLILTYQGRPIEALYHSTCGGHTAANQSVFGGKPLPYLQGTPDQNPQAQNYCQNSPHSHWQSSLSLRELRTVFKHPKLRSLASVDLDQDGRVDRIVLKGENSTSLLAQDFLLQIGRHLGWHRLKSLYFSVEKKDDVFIFTGKGLGHGVGMCQWGAKGMALAGKGFREILRHYFPGTRLEQQNSI